MRNALLVGINYKGTKSELRGCINDIINMKFFLKSSRNYDNITLLSDDAPDRMPTKSNILANLTSLVANSRPGDEIFFHFSGHGTLIRDTNGDEESGYDSVICPVDFLNVGFITDDVLRGIVNNVPAGVTLYAFLDCCHSGTGFDLRYKYEDNSKYLKPGIPSTYTTTDWQMKQSYYQFKKYAKTNGNVFMVSGCKDDQTSADALEEGQFTGALTYCILKTLRSNYGNCKWKIFLKDLSCLLKVKGYSQRPVLTSGNFLNMDNTVFITKQSKSIDDLLDSCEVCKTLLNK